MHFESWGSLSDEALVSCSLTSLQAAENFNASASVCDLPALGQRDIAEVNLAAAFDLPRAGRLDIPALRKNLDEWAEVIEYATAKSIRQRASHRRIPLCLQAGAACDRLRARF